MVQGAYNKHIYETQQIKTIFCKFSKYWGVWGQITLFGHIEHFDSIAVFL